MRIHKCHVSILAGEMWMQFENDRHSPSFINAIIDNAIYHTSPTKFFKFFG